MKASTRPGRASVMGSVAAALEVLEVLGNHGKELPLGAIAQAAAMPKSSTYRTLASLVGLGLVEQEEKRGDYRLSLKLWRIGVSALQDLDLLKISQPHLERLMQTTDETVHLSVLDTSGGVIYINKVESARSIRVQTQVGRLNPSWCTATGRAILAFRPEIAAKVLAAPLEARTTSTVTDPQKLRTIMENVARSGFVCTRAENHPEMGGIAAPIRDHSGTVVASCGIAIPVFRMDSSLIHNAVPIVVQTAEAISSRLGFLATQMPQQAAAERRVRR